MSSNNPHETIHVIKPTESWSREYLRELWDHRELLWMFALRDIKVRYKQTVMGVAWAVLQPVLTMLIFTIIFGRIAKIPSDGIPYPVFVFSGLLAWNFFNASVGAAAGSLVASSHLITKVYFPRLIVPIATIGVAVVEFGIAALILIALMLMYGVVPSTQIILTPLFLLGLFVTTVGISAWLSAVTVAFRDFRFVVPFMLQIWMYITPVIYPLSFIPEQWRWILYLNPVAGWVGAIRASLLGTSIDWFAVGCSVVLSVGAIIIAMRYFRRAEQRFADII